MNPNKFFSKDLSNKIRVNLEGVSGEEERYSLLENEDYETKENELRLISLEQDIKERKKFAKWIFITVVGWLFCILGVIICTGLGCLKISDPVSLALIGSTTVNIIALFVIIAKYLFPSNLGQ